MRFRPFGRLLLVLALTPAARAQDSSRSLPPVTVTATREGVRPALELPYAITSVRPDSFAAIRRLGVDELLFAIPGVALANRQNPAQDPRVSIRGFGARSAFGVRGVRVLQDGVPVTLPDGQTPVDVLDVEGAARVDVLRGSASSLYGNAAGGVIDLRSATPPPENIAPYGRITGGADTPTLTAAGAAGTVGALGYTSSVTRVNGAGYRNYSDQRGTHGAIRLTRAPADGTAGTTVVVAARVTDVSRAQSPGAITQAQMDADPRQADALSVRKQAGKIVRQGDLSLSAAHPLGASGSVDAVIYGSGRTLQNPLTFATVDVDRKSGGASVRVSDATGLASRTLRLSGGADIQWQHDDRHERENCVDATAVSATCPAGAALRGAMRKDQLELVTSAGPYLRGELALSPRLLASAGVRADAVRFEVRDNLINATNPDDSGERTLHAVSPSLGVVWRRTPLSAVYASLSSSFETPTTTELGNKPDGSAGINPELQPQRTVAMELGSKGLLSMAPVRWDVALFEARARDELVPFDIPGGAGRRYYRNAGRTVRRGGELGLEADAGGLGVRVAYSYSHFRYQEYIVGTTSYAGNRIPGVPEHALATTLAWRHDDLTLSTTADIASAVDVDDANSTQARGRTMLGVGAGTTLRVGGARLLPLVEIQNVTGVRTAGSVSVNATGGKFFEPAPGRVLLVRLGVSRDVIEHP
jgi:iron complex outermembrane receptor protein